MMNAYIAMHCACVDRMSNDEETRANTVSCSECKDVTQRGHVQNAVISCSKCGEVMFKTEMSWEIHAQLPRLLSVLNCAESMSTTHPAWVPMDVYPHACPAHRNMMLKTQSEMSAWKKSILKVICTLGLVLGLGPRLDTYHVPMPVAVVRASDWISEVIGLIKIFESWMDLITKWHGTSHQELDT